MVYNVSAFDNITSNYDIVLGLNSITNDLFVPLFLFAIYFLIMFVMSSRWGFRKSFVATSFLVTFVSVLLWGNGLIAAKLVIIPLSLALASILVYVMNKE